MAKTKRSKKATTTTTEGSTLTTKVSKLLAELETPFMAFAEGFAHLSTARSELAPQFMQACRAWQRETHGTFVAFVRLFDATVPLHRAGYRAHTTYQSADYLRRLRNKRRGQSVPIEQRSVSPLVALARLVATVMPVVDPTGTIWAAFVKAMNWSDEQAERLKVLSAREGAISLPPRTKHSLVTLRAAA